MTSQPPFSSLHLNDRSVGAPGTRAARTRRRPLLPALVAALIAPVGATLGSAAPSAADEPVSLPPLTRAQATPIDALPAWIGVTVPGLSTPMPSAGTGGSGHPAAAAAVRDACSDGAPLHDAQWYLLVDGWGDAAAAVWADPQLEDYEAPWRMKPRFAYVTTDPVSVIGCGPGAAAIPADQPVLVVVYFEEQVSGECGDPYGNCSEPYARGVLRATSGSAPSNDNWRNAERMPGGGFTEGADTRSATFDGPVNHPVSCYSGPYEPSDLPNIWYRWTPSFSGAVDLRIDSPDRNYEPSLRLLKSSADGPVPVPDVGSIEECWEPQPVTVEAGKEYYVMVGGEAVFYEPPFQDSTGLVVFSVTPAGSADGRAVYAPEDFRFSVTPGAASATVRWQPPRPADSDPPSGYEVRRVVSDQQGSTTFEWSSTLAASARQLTFTHLSPWAMNHLSVSPAYGGEPGAGAQVTVIPSAGVPSAPRAPSTAAGPTRLTVKWRSPAATGTASITGYRVRLYKDGASAAWKTWTVGTGARSHTATGLALDHSYSFDVTAINAVGRGRPSVKTRDVELKSVPGPAQNVAATTNYAARTATLTWSPPQPNGSTVIRYVVGRNGTDSAGVGPWSARLPASARSQTFKRLVPDLTYDLYVVAVAKVGNGEIRYQPVTLRVP